MIIFAVDDEEAILAELHDAIREARPEAEIHDFRLAKAALEAISQKHILPDVVFSDIEMPGMDGLSLAARIKQQAPASGIVFVTGYSHYAVEAYRRHVNGYVLKPVDADQIREELEFLTVPYRQETGKLQIRCFGFFEVFWQGKPVSFNRKQTKDLLAFLVDRNCECSSEEIADALWEGDSDIRACRTRLRNLVHDLKGTLSGIGAGDVLIRRRDRIGIESSQVDCDYFRFLEGDIQAVNAFRGEYMTQYSWAEATLGRLLFKG